MSNKSKKGRTEIYLFIFLFVSSSIMTGGNTLPKKRYHLSFVLCVIREREKKRRDWVDGWIDISILERDGKEGGKTGGVLPFFGIIFMCVLDIFVLYIPCQTHYFFSFDQGCVFLEGGM
ncbi:hypothetical protein QBC38DRAFT_129904 [Podospora fimiseda]|uniref:Transmembrane protein n=1 Tax=Podospora fimiseda TaxID=252190 RepID=A0AAN7BF04_9PEZI|nr:hypothetical protein QBC38DRAFT_129904 [Podospora fimiseda]